MATAPPLPVPRRRSPNAVRRRWVLPVGRVLGVPVTIHASFAFLVALFLAGSRVDGAPALPTQLVWLTALFACVVGHELAHALVARARGVAVQEIELLPFGGLTRFASDPRTPQDDLVIAAAGPLANVAIAGALAVVATAYGVAVWPPALYGGSLVNRLVWLNLLLGAGNLLPISPLDGGAVLRDALIGHIGKERAQLLVIRMGRVGGVGLILAGLFVDAWLAVIGAVVLFAAGSQETAFWIEHTLVGLSIGDLPIHTGHAVPGDVPVVDLAAPLVDCPLRRGWRCALVRRDGAIVGAVYAADLEALMRERLPRR